MNIKLIYTWFGPKHQLQLSTTNLPKYRRGMQSKTKISSYCKTVRKYMGRLTFVWYIYKSAHLSKCTSKRKKLKKLKISFKQNNRTLMHVGSNSFCDERKLINLQQLMYKKFFRSFMITVLILIKLFVKWATEAAPTGKTDQNGKQNNPCDYNPDDGPSGDCEWATGWLPSAHIWPGATPVVIIPIRWLWTIRKITIAGRAPPYFSVSQSAFDILSRWII